MALMPVCSGSLTGWRPMMPGAWTSMRRCWGSTSGPLPSIGSPSAFTTRPSSASPTGIDRMRPVARTTCSSSMPSTEPSTTAPMVSSSRFIARPSGAVFELEQLVHLGRGQTRDARDAVADLDDAADLLGADGRVVLGDVLAQGVSDLVGTNGELSHHSFLFLVVSIQSGFVEVTRRRRRRAGRRGVRGSWRRGAGRRPRPARRRAGRAPRRSGVRRSCRSASASERTRSACGSRRRAGARCSTRATRQSRARAT